MAIICDNCKSDVTPDEDTEINMYEMVDLNGKKCFCHTCYCALSEFVESDGFKKVVEDYKKEMD